MIKIVQDITLDINLKSTYKFVYAKQGDNKSRFIRISLVGNGVVYRPDPGVRANFRAKKPDGAMIVNDCQIDGDGKVLVELSQQTLAVCGDVIADVYLTDGYGSVVSTSNFVISVVSPPDGADAVSENEFLLLLSTVERAEAAARKAEDIIASGGGSGGAGGRDGVTFTPHVSSAGIISWTNNGGLSNPPPVNIKGKTPVKGTDYWTQSDRLSIINDVLSNLPTWNGGIY